MTKSYEERIDAAVDEVLLMSECVCVESALDDTPKGHVIALGGTLGQIMLASAMKYAEKNSLSLEEALTTIMVEANTYMNFALNRSHVCECENSSHCVDHE